MTLTDSQIWAIANGLRVAAGVYRADASCGCMTPELVAQFIRQADEIEALATALEAGAPVGVPS